MSEGMVLGLGGIGYFLTYSLDFGLWTLVISFIIGMIYQYYTIEADDIIEAFTLGFIGMFKSLFFVMITGASISFFKWILQLF